MADITEFRAGDGTVLRVEVDDAPVPYDGDVYEPVRRRGQDADTTANAVGDTLRRAVDRVRPAAQDVLDSLRSMPQAPDRVALEFGVKLSADAGVVLARASTEAHFKVLLEWERQRPEGRRGENAEGSEGSEGSESSAESPASPAPTAPTDSADSLNEPSPGGPEPQDASG
ncbi:CU044_2847 family protein [Streptomyces sp. NPDC052309]|uniref:CU044_2847 family protein n=1 Tax=Streptomyces sp. NPDC052309 TaxID=3155421 RepID=UPI0034331DB4